MHLTCADGLRGRMDTWMCAMFGLMYTCTLCMKSCTRWQRSANVCPVCVCMLEPWQSIPLECRVVMWTRQSCNCGGELHGGLQGQNGFGRTERRRGGAGDVLLCRRPLSGQLSSPLNMGRALDAVLDHRVDQNAKPDLSRKCRQGGCVDGLHRRVCAISNAATADRIQP